MARTKRRWTRGTSRGGKGGNKGNRDDRDRDGEDGKGWKSVPLENETFENYYKAQGILPEGEWDAFMKAMRDPLPTTFRVTGSSSFAQDVNEVIKSTYVPLLSDVTFEGQKLQPPRQIPWYPEGLAWQLNVAKYHIRKSSEFKKFQDFLVYETEAGNLSRQEAVSMIPPLLLDVEPHHIVLDTCAAPGSKTAQLLEALHTPRSTSSTSTSQSITPVSAPTSEPSALLAPSAPLATSPPDPIPKGLLIANDADFKRTHMLVHQSLNRIPSASMMVTNVDASQFPTLRIPSHILRSDQVRNQVEGKVKYEPLYFDRILCDVPCSGDGTLRKNLAIWREWNPRNGSGLHTLQLRILLRAVQLLKPGGRLVYSTCSLNPAENEAVISAALDAEPELIELVDVSDRLPGLKRRPGMTNWKVFNRAGDEIQKEEKDEKQVETMWPNGKEGERHIERCLRIYPHLQDTGGFFVAVLQKPLNATTTARQQKSRKTKRATGETTSKRKADEIEPLEGHENSVKRIKSEDTAAPVDASSLQECAQAEDEEKPMAAETEIAADEEDGEEGGGEDEAEATAVMEPDAEGKAGEKREKGKEFKEDPYTFLPEGNEVARNCIEFFDFTPSFPHKNLLVRNSDGKAQRSVYLTSDLVRGIIESNDYKRMRLISCGVRMFVRQDSNQVYPCKWRIMGEGIGIARSFMGETRVLGGDLEVLRSIIGPDLYPPLRNLPEKFKNDVEAIDLGSCVIDIEPSEFNGASLKNRLTLPLWRSPTSLALMLDKVEKSALSLRLFGQDFTPHPKKAKAETRQEKKGKQKRGGDDGEGGEEAETKEEQDQDGVSDGDVEADLLGGKGSGGDAFEAPGEDAVLDTAEDPLQE